VTEERRIESFVLARIKGEQRVFYFGCRFWLRRSRRGRGCFLSCFSYNKPIETKRVWEFLFLLWPREPQRNREIASAASKGKMKQRRRWTAAVLRERNKENWEKRRCVKPKGLHLLFIETLSGWDYSKIDQGLRGFNVGSKLSNESSQGIISYN